jgi:RecA-family ATPase
MQHIQEFFSGLRKSNIELHQCIAHVLGRDWLQTLPELGPAIFVECEDDEKELRRRAACVLNGQTGGFLHAKVAPLLDGRERTLQPDRVG